VFGAVAAVGCEEEWEWEGEVCWYVGLKGRVLCGKMSRMDALVGLACDSDAMPECRNEDKTAEQIWQSTSTYTMLGIAG
jgi:hypothetical protein